MDKGFLEFPPIFSQTFNQDHDLENYFLSLPEETQQAIINADIHSGKDLYDCIEEYRLKE